MSPGRLRPVRRVPGRSARRLWPRYPNDWLQSIARAFASPPLVVLIGTMAEAARRRVRRSVDARAEGNQLGVKRSAEVSVSARAGRPGYSGAAATTDSPG